MEPPCDAGYALPTSAAAARDLVRALLERQPAPPAGRPAPAEQTVTDVLLVTSELVTNAIRHAGGVTAFTAVVEDGFVYVMVGDASSAPPVRSPAAAPAGPAATAGRWCARWPRTSPSPRTARAARTSASGCG